MDINYRDKLNATICWLFLLCSAFVVDYVNAEDSTHQLSGEKIFLKYCAGCHGFDGFAAYEYAPSFSMGERMQKDDSQLLQSVLKGLNGMPPWQDKLSVGDLREAIAYIRTMHERNQKGELSQQQLPEDTYYLFKPVGEEDMDWRTKKKQQ